MILKSSLIIFSANFFAHFLNYAYHLIAGRFLIPSDLGLLESFVALNYFLAVLISTFSLSIIHLINQTPPAKQPAVISQLQRLSFKLTLTFWLIFLSLYPILKPLLHLKNPYIFIIFSLQILFSFVPTLYSGLLQAKLKFASFSLVNLLSPIIKILSALFFFIMGLKVFGAIASLAITSLATAIIAFLLVKKHLNLKTSKPIKLPRSFWQFSSAALITNLSLTSLYNSDILLVRFYLPDQAGFYAAAALLVKIIFFVSAAILTVAFPVFTLHANNLTQLKRSFSQSLFLITAIAFLGTTVYQLYPNLIIKLFPNPAYSQAAAFLPSFSLFIFFFTLLNLFSQLLLTLDKRYAAVSSLSSALLQLILIILFHQNLMQIIQNSIVAALAGLIVASGVTIKLLYAKT